MSRSAELFAVSADTAYEGSEMVAVFDSKDAAEAFAERCRAHDKLMPQAPDEIEDTPENDALWDAWGEKLRRWSAKHPAKLKSARDGFSVNPIRYFKA